MKRISAGRYELEANGFKYVVLKEVEEVPHPKEEGKLKTLVSWTPYLDGNAEAFGGQSYQTYKTARDMVYQHVRENLADI